MSLVTLKSRLSNITRSNPTPEKTSVTPRATDFFSNEDGKGFTIRQSKNDTKLRITGFSQNPEFNEKNKFQEPVNPQESRLKIAWDKMKDDYYARGQKDNDRFGIRQNSTQPYIIREIGETWGNQSNGIDIIRGGASTYASRVSNDVIRQTKYLSDNPSYVLKQQFLQTFNVGGDLGERANIYNPLSPQLNTQGFIKTQRHLDIPIVSDFIRQKMVGGLASFNQLNLSSLGAPANQARYKDIDLSLGGLLGLASDKVPDIKTSEGTPLDFYQKIVKGIDQKEGDKVNLIPYGSRKYKTTDYGGSSEVGLVLDLESEAIIDNKTEDDLDFIPFRFKDVNSGNYIVFRAILSGITDTFTPEYSPERYIGRPDSVYVYQGTQREISFTFDIYPKSKKELEVLWEKINYLSGLSYPALGNINGGGQAMIAPFCELTIGDMYNDTPGYISGLTHTVQDNGTWEIETGLRLPKYIQTAVTFVYIGKRLPTSTSKHYDLPWMKETTLQDPY